MSYDSTQDTLEHIQLVRQHLRRVRDILAAKAADHDASKLEEPEKSLYDEWAPKLRAMTYGSDEYKEALAQMGPALQHHYEHNNHHPEHFTDGVNDMSLLEIIEMLCDWRAANLQYGGNFAESIKRSCRRFGIDPQLGQILMNTAYDLGWVSLESVTVPVRLDEASIRNAERVAASIVRKALC